MYIFWLSNGHAMVHNQGDGLKKIFEDQDYNSRSNLGLHFKFIIKIQDQDHMALNLFFNFIAIIITFTLIILGLLFLLSILFFSLSFFSSVFFQTYFENVSLELRVY